MYSCHLSCKSLKTIRFVRICTKLSEAGAKNHCIDKNVAEYDTSARRADIRCYSFDSTQAASYRDPGPSLAKRRHFDYTALPALQYFLHAGLGKGTR